MDGQTGSDTDRRCTLPDTRLHIGWHSREQTDSPRPLKHQHGQRPTEWKSEHPIQMLSRMLSQCLLLLALVLYNVQGKAINEHAGASHVCMGFIVCVGVCLDK